MSNTPETYVEKGIALYYERAIAPQFINFCYDKKALHALEIYFGEFPITIDRDDITVLEAIQAAGCGRPIDDLIKAIERDGAIRVWWDSEHRHAREDEHYASQRGRAVLD